MTTILNNLNCPAMSLRVESTIEDRIIRKGESLKTLLDSAGSELKNAMIGYRCIRGEIPIDIDYSNDIAWMQFKSTVDSLAEFGVCFVSEEDFHQFVSSLDGESEEICDDHEAWSGLTLLEIVSSQKFEEYFLESYLYQNGEQLNSVGIDLVGRSDVWELFTCKFNVSNQHVDANRRLDILIDISSRISDTSIVAIGTLAIQHKDAISSFFDVDVDKIVSAEDLLELQRN